QISHGGAGIAAQRRPFRPGHQCQARGKVDMHQNARESAAGSDDERTATGTSDPSPAWYLLAVLAGLVGALALFWLTLFGLDRSGNLPPPAFSNNLCVDEKLNFLRDHPIHAPNLLII